MLDETYIDLVRERVLEKGLPCSDQHILECLKFLALVSASPGRRIAVTPDVDEVWHELIVQTARYRRLCAALPSGRFIDHESITPTAYEERVGGKESVDEFLRWLPEYVSCFGPFTEERARHWTIVAFLREQLGMSLAEINDAARSAQADAILAPGSVWLQLASDDLSKVVRQEQCTPTTS